MSFMTVAVSSAEVLMGDFFFFFRQWLINSSSKPPIFVLFIVLHCKTSDTQTHPHFPCPLTAGSMETQWALLELCCVAAARPVKSKAIKIFMALPRSLYFRSLSGLRGTLRPSRLGCPLPPPTS